MSGRVAPFVMFPDFKLLFHVNIRAKITSEKKLKVTISIVREGYKDGLIKNNCSIRRRVNFH